jgi:hypothetical protein
MGLPLITRTEYKEYVGINSSNEDAIIDSLVPRVSELVKTYCRRSFVDYVSTNKTEVVNGGYGSSLFLKEFPLIEVVSFSQSSDYGQTYTALTANTDFAVDLEDDRIQSLSELGFPKVINGYRIVYKAGYQELPEDLKLAVMDLITYYRKNDMAVHSPKAPGTNSVQVEYITTSAFPAHIRRILDLYKGSWD